ncbi:hypothetical protein BP6252_11036 [Coleophoma cylindrospora]|uniref:Glycoside hydrolase family 28 protein n=1 Tax=Coleophoma cylindrospora TaxID=1849047 RepID=A0A3D8QP39_9HELO|nr:hypothetical protein BP6252_11036 [Coleophoma cylindrospora]
MAFFSSNLVTKTLLITLSCSASLVQAVANIDFTALGAVTPLSAKSTICNVLDYGGVADGVTDIGPAITKTFTSCVSGNAATLYVPEGNYSLATGVTLSGATVGWAFQLDGLITLTSDGVFGGNAFYIENTSDLEFFSSNNLGAINGQGYIARRDATGQNARLVRFVTIDNLSVHNIILIDSPAFHLILTGVTNAEVYYITIRGGDKGATDGIDISCAGNCYVHDFEVTNRDECVSVKAPSDNILIEDAYCNNSGGMSIGSLSAAVTSQADVAKVSNVTMRNIYAFECTQMLMIKTYPGGTGSEGYVTDSLFENFWGYDTTYALDIDQYWGGTYTPDTGAVAIYNLTFNNFTGSLADGMQRGAMNLRGSDIVPMQDITLIDFDFFNTVGDRIVNQCNNVYGSGGCIPAESGTSTFDIQTTTWVAATSLPAAPSWAVSGYGLTIPIPVYTPAVMWPTASTSAAAAAITGATAVAAVKSDSQTSTSASFVASSTSVAVSSPAISSPTSSSPESSRTAVISTLVTIISSMSSSAVSSTSVTTTPIAVKSTSSGVSSVPFTSQSDFPKPPSTQPNSNSTTEYEPKPDDIDDTCDA